MRRSYVVVLLVVIVVGIGLRAADLPPIQLDRPDQTECPFIVPTGYVQCESGFLLERTQGSVTTATFPSALWKYGVNEKFELRMITEFTRVASANSTALGLAPITLGFKSSLFEESGIVPKTSFIGHITTSNLGSEEFHTTYIAPSFRFVMLHTLPGDISLSYNLGAEWTGEDAEHTYIYTLTAGAPLTDRLGFYVEAYGFAPADSPADHRADGGLTYLVNDNLMLDVSGGLGLVNTALDHYVALGVSWRWKV
ncbi:MAG: transporter [Candidatus Kapaibacterium sp.]